jgi:poly-gamma-glutamate synthesis protein (capsule biosynthesis protein)
MSTLAESATIRLFLCGDVMLGRGLDQAMAVSCDPRLYEPGLTDARDYLALAERANGPIPRPLPPAYVWGDALAEMTRPDIDLRVINLETSVTTSEDYWPAKGINYRMHPANIACLQAARIDCCCLANNHVLDWGYAGLAETIATLDRAGIAHAGAGANAAAAAAPAVLEAPGKGRVLVFSFASPSSGVPEEWVATKNRPGVNFLEELSETSAERVLSKIGEHRREEELVVVSVHWGGNWGYEIPEEQARFAHHLLARGVSVVHGHSSHHPKGAEIFGDGLALYGCGDFLNDYEGIAGYEEFRSDLTAGWLATFTMRGKQLVEARLLPMRLARYRLNRPSPEERAWLQKLLTELCAARGARVALTADGALQLERAAADDGGAP